MKQAHTTSAIKSPVLLHPLVVLRVASEPAALINSDGRTAASITQCAAMECALRDAAAALASRLEAALPGITDVQVSRTLLQVKRDVYNLRALSEGKLAKVLALMPADLADALVALNEQIAALHAARGNLAQVYQDELADGVGNLREAASRRNLSHGISYSNPELYGELQRLFATGEHRFDSKKQRNLEDTLMQYALRCATKISPLSAFTLVNVSAWDHGNTDLNVGFPGSVESRTEFKAALSRYLINPLLTNYSVARGRWPLRLNPTARTENGRLLWRTVSSGSLVTGRTWGTREESTQVTPNGAIQCILHIFTKSGQAALSTDALIGEIRRLAPKLTLPAADRVVRQLFELGALLADTGFYEQQDPLETLASLLPLVDDSLAALLNEIAAEIAQFPAAGAAQRGVIVKSVRAKVATLAAGLETPLSEKIAHPAFFENCYLQTPQRTLSWDALQPFHDSLAFMLELAPLIDVNQKVRSAMADAFVEQFGRYGQCKDVEGFIRGFDEQYRPGQLFGPARPSRSLAQSETSRLQTLAAKAFNDFIGAALRGGVDVELDRAQLKAILEILPIQVRNRSTSHSFLGQLCLNDGASPKFVINQMLGGRSSMMSRFLESVGDAELEQVREYLRASTPYGQFAVIPGVFGFNGNRHPRLADGEIGIAPFASAWNDTEKLAVDTLSASYNAEQHSLRFHDGQGKPLDIWYPGFLIPSLLPPVQRALALSATDGHINFSFSAIMGSGAVSGDRVTRLPRVSLGDVVLMRRTHVIPTTFLPPVDLAPFEFFQAFQEWRKEHGLPESFFVRQLPLDVDPAASESWWNLNPKDMKPFYVRHDNPRLVRLMQRAMKKNNLPLFIAEALPALDDQHVDVAGHAHVAEIQFELTRLAMATDAEPRRTSVSKGPLDVQYA